MRDRNRGDGGSEMSDDGSVVGPSDASADDEIEGFGKEFVFLHLHSFSEGLFRVSVVHGGRGL